MFRQNEDALGLRDPDEPERGDMSATQQRIAMAYQESLRRISEEYEEDSVEEVVEAFRRVLEVEELGFQPPKGARARAKAKADAVRGSVAQSRTSPTDASSVDVPVRNPKPLVAAPASEQRPAGQGGN